MPHWQSQWHTQAHKGLWMVPHWRSQWHTQVATWRPGRGGELSNACLVDKTSRVWRRRMIGTRLTAWLDRTRPLLGVGALGSALYIIGLLDNRPQTLWFREAHVCSPYLSPGRVMSWHLPTRKA